MFKPTCVLLAAAVEVDDMFTMLPAPIELLDISNVETVAEVPVKIEPNAHPVIVVLPVNVPPHFTVPAGLSVIPLEKA